MMVLQVERGAVDGEDVGVGEADFSGEAGHDLAVAVAYERTDGFVGERAAEVNLIPVTFVPVPGWLYFAMVFAQVFGIVGVAFNCNRIGTLQIQAPEDFIADAEKEVVRAKGHVLGDKRQGKGVFSDFLYVHSGGWQSLPLSYAMFTLNIYKNQ